jgi:hypothetical protein
MVALAEQVEQARLLQYQDKVVALVFPVRVD